MRRLLPCFVRLGPYVLFGFVVLSGFFEIFIDALFLRDGRVALSAKWMGAGLWFGWLLAAQMAIGGLASLSAAGIWLRRRNTLKLSYALGFGLASAFLGPSHEPFADGWFCGFWLMYAIQTLAMAFWFFVYIYVSRKQAIE